MKYETIVCPFCGNGHAHITYEENRVYQMNCPDCHNAIFHRDTSWDNAVNFFKRMVVTDETAIRQQECVGDANKSLTLDELRKMDGQPVYLHTFSPVQKKTNVAQWSILETVGSANATFLRAGVNSRLTKWFCNYGERWLAYRQKPEEG